MKKFGMKRLAALGLTLCIMVAGALPTLAISFSSGSHTHQWEQYETTTTNCYDVYYTVRDAEGNAQTLILCPTCGKIGGKDYGVELLSKVSNTTSNYSDLYVFKGTLPNGMEVLTIAFYYPERNTYMRCAVCGIGYKVAHTDESMPQNPMTASIQIPVDVVKGYTMMRVNADGTETPLEVSMGERKASFSLTLDEGACMIHLVKEEEPVVEAPAEAEVDPTMGIEAEVTTEAAA